VKWIAGLALVATTLMSLGGGSAAAPEAARPSFRTTDPGFVAEAEVLLGDRVIMRLSAPAGGLSVEERAMVVAARLTSLTFHGLDPRSISPMITEDGSMLVMASGLPLVTVDAETVHRQGVDRASLALTWANNLREALGAPGLELHDESGLASWYGPGFHGRITANGEVFDQYGLTAAHRTLPFGTKVIVTRPDTGHSVTVRINDRGPWRSGRVIDLSLGAARRLGIVERGLKRVTVVAWLSPRDGGR
jgi:rare lipoprotein A